MCQGSELKVRISLTLGWVLELPAVLTLSTYLGTNRPDNLMTSPGDLGWASHPAEQVHGENSKKGVLGKEEWNEAHFLPEL